MEVRRFEEVDGFVVIDLPAATTSVGVVRSAPKVLLDSATLLARCVTYAFASLGQQRGGASAGVNATPDERPDALASFMAQIAPLVASGAFLPDAGKGVTEADLAAVRADDGRDPRCRSQRSELVAAGAVEGAAHVMGELAGRTVAVEFHDGTGGAVVAAASACGAKVIAVGNASAAVVDPDGIDPTQLGEAVAGHGDAAVAHLDRDAAPGAALFAAGADVVFCGSKGGLVDHIVANGLTARCLAPTGPVPVTAKALAVLTRAGVVVLPDFVTTLGPLMAAWPSAATADDVLVAEVSATVAGVLGDVAGHPRGLYLGACERAEVFLRTWQDDLPFGRPLA